MNGRWTGHVATRSVRPISAGRGRWSTTVGIGIHSSQEIEEEADALHTDMMTFGKEMRDQLFLDSFDQPRPDADPDKLKLYHEVWRPLMNEWLEFHEQHAHWWSNLPLSGAWDKIQEYRQRFIAVRDKAKEMKFKLISPEPLKPHEDPKVTDVGDMLKGITYAALAIGGVVLAAKLIPRAQVPSAPSLPSTHSLG